ncbi:unnamed protein product [Ilex paraguariensis]|uniref:Uncharacterized protein n=1 Tax=Ilex paraguariensis TaxID=185542 RepID=A0ABC8QLI3_9AQUA
MKNKNQKKKPAAQKGKTQKGKKRFPINEDPFFDAPENSKRRRKIEDDDIESSEEEYDNDPFSRDAERAVEEEEEETAAERRKRVAEAYLEKIRAITKREKAEEDEEEEREGEREGERDSLVAKILQQEQLEESGRVRRSIASRFQKPETTDGFRVLVKHRQSVTAVALSEDDSKGFSSSKDGTIVQWDVESGKRENYVWPSEEVLKSHGEKDPQGRAAKHSKHVLSLAVSSDGRYLASGGLDRHIHLWDTRTREHIQTFPGHKGPVSCLTFRQGTSELFSGSFDRSVKIWNADDRAYINTLFGHQSELLTIDCLRKERVLTVGRDRTMHLWKPLHEGYILNGWLSTPFGQLPPPPFSTRVYKKNKSLFSSPSSVFAVFPFGPECSSDLTSDDDEDVDQTQQSSTTLIRLHDDSRFLKLITCSVESSGPQLMAVFRHYIKRQKVSAPTFTSNQPVPEESQLVFRARASSLECCCFINNDEFLSGSDDGSIEHWSILRKKPIHIFKNAHALFSPYKLEDRNELSNGHLENGDYTYESVSSSAHSWVSSVAVCRNSDLAASGAGNGLIRLWEIENEAKGIRPLFELPMVGFVNSLAFARSGRFLVAGVGQEPRLGRWERNPAARNGVAMHSLKLS